MAEGARSNLVPASIVIGAGIIATGLYLGLRERGAVEAPTLAPSSMAVPPTGAPLTMQPPPSTPSTTGDAATVTTPAPPVPLDGPRARATKEVEDVLGARRKGLTTTCWAPSSAAAAAPASATFRLRFQFDASGKATRVVSDQPADARKDVAACLERELAEVSVTAGAGSLGVQVELTLP